MKKYFRKFVGDRAFYRMVLVLAVPVMIQNGFTNFVSLLDNIMVGQVGTDQMSGVAIANQLIFIFNLCIFGGMSGAGIFSAQYYGKSDWEGIRRVTRIKLWIAVIVSLFFFLITSLYGTPLISLFLHEGSVTGDPEATLAFGLEYLKVIRWQLLPFALIQVYASMLRETSKTRPPMVAGVVAVLVNLLFNWLLIFGKLGFPALGVVGAAAATVLSRFVELAICAGWTHRHPVENPYIVGLYKTVFVPKSLLSRVMTKGMPLLLNELLWSSGMTVLSQCYSTRGLAVVAATNIANVISQLFNIVFMSLGSSIGIVVGNLLGANRMKEARETDTKMIAFSVGSCFFIGLLMFLVAPKFPRLYNTTEEVRQLAERFIMISAAIMPFHAFTHSCYFTLRSGGKTLITFLYDSVFLWAVNVLCAFLLTRFTSLPILPLYAICQSIEILKCLFGYFFVRSDIWMQNIIKEQTEL